MEESLGRQLRYGFREQKVNTYSSYAWSSISSSKRNIRSSSDLCWPESDTNGNTFSFVVCMPERYHEDVRSSSLWIEIGSRAPDDSGVEGEGERDGCVVDDVESIAGH